MKPVNNLPKILNRAASSGGVMRVRIDKHLAAQAESMYYDRNRKTTNSWVSHYAELASSGQWSADSTFSFARLPDGAYVLLNGHHRMTALQMCDVAVDAIFSVQCVSSWKEVQELHAVFDLAGRNRTIADISHSLDLQSGLTGEFLKFTSRAVGIIEGGWQMMGTRHAEKRQRAEAIRSWADAAQLAHSSFPKRSPIVPNWTRAAVLSIVLPTVRYSPALALPFWRAAITLDNVPARAPAQYANRIISAQVGTGRAANKVEAYRLAELWNANVMGVEISRMPTPPNDWPGLLGTPYVK